MRVKINARDYNENLKAAFGPLQSDGLSPIVNLPDNTEECLILLGPFGRFSFEYHNIYAKLPIIYFENDYD